MIIELKKRRNFPSLGMGKTAAYDVKCDVTGLKSAQFVYSIELYRKSILLNYNSYRFIRYPNF